MKHQPKSNSEMASILLLVAELLKDYMLLKIKPLRKTNLLI